MALNVFFRTGLLAVTLLLLSNCDPFNTDSHNHKLLLRYYTFEEKSGPAVLDHSWYHVDGVLSGGDRIPSKAGQCLNFSTSGSVVCPANGEDFDENSFSIIVWINPTELDNDATYFIVGWPQDWNGYHLQIRHQKPEFIRDFGQSYLLANGNTTIQINQWIHIACTYDGKHSKLYVNGILESEMESVFELRIKYCTNFSICHSNSLLGHSNSFRYSQYIGSIDEVKIWNKALSAEEILADYEKTK